MALWKLERSRATGLLSVLLMMPSLAAHAEGACSNGVLKDVFIQGGQQVLDESQLRILSLGQDEMIAQTDAALTCRYLMELSDHSKRWVRFTFSIDTAGQAAIDYEEEAKSTSR